MVINNIYITIKYKNIKTVDTRIILHEGCAMTKANLFLIALTVITAIASVTISTIKDEPTTVTRVNSSFTLAR